MLKLKKSSKKRLETQRRRSRGRAEVYFDYNATTPLDKRVLEKMLPYLETFYGNPSSIYRFAQSARKAVEDARENIAKLICASPEEIIFTSGGTEANNSALKGIAFSQCSRGKHIITSAIEHQAVLNPCGFLKTMGFEVSYVGVDEYGMVRLDELKKNIRDDTILVSIMHANNEVGTIQPIEEVGSICREREIYFHTDAVQTAGRIPLNVKDLGVDLLSFSAHKLYGPKGVGALYVRKKTPLHPLIHGGKQERGMRAGTENVGGIVGFSEAATIAGQYMQQDQARVGVLRKKLEEGILKYIPEVKVNGHPKKRLYNTLNVSIKHTEGESVLINLDFEGICASGGSACASGSLEASHVLLAMGLSPALARGAIRFSCGRYNTKEEVDRVLKVLPSIVDKLRSMSSSWQGR